MVFAAAGGGAIGKNRSSGGFEVEEFSARTVDEALAEASAKLGLPARELIYEVRDSGASGFLGIGSRPANVAVRIATPPTAASPSPNPAEDVRVVMEAAQRLGASMSKVRQRAAAGTLVYDPDERRLVEATPKGFEEDAEKAAVDHAENPPDSSDATKVGTGESGLAGYLTVPEASRMLGESVPDVLGKIGRRELACERISGVVKVRRQAVVAIKEGQAPRSHRSSRPAERKTESRLSETGNGGSELKSPAGNRLENLQERAAMLEGELRVLRKELEKERLLRQQRDEWITDLLSKLGNGNSRRSRGTTPSHQRSLSVHSTAAGGTASARL